MNRGYIALFRRIQDHPFYKEKRVFSKYEAWIDLLMESQHSKDEIDILIKMTVVKCGYGQSVKSLRTWGDRWGWCPKKVTRFFKLLEKMDQIRYENVTVSTRITILNYSKYNIDRHANATVLPQFCHTSATELPHECPTDKNEKNEKNEKEIEAEFEKFWSLYDKKEDPKKCLAKWKKLKKADKEKIFETLPAYVESTPDKQYRKHPATYLNNQSWNNEITKKQGGIKKDGFDQTEYHSEKYRTGYDAPW